MSCAGILLSHSRRRPRMETADYVKLLYQSEFGPGHLVRSGQALERLAEEVRQAGPAEEGRPAFEAIGPDLCRAYFSQEFSPLQQEVLARCLAHSARPRGGGRGLWRKLGVLSALAWSGQLPLEGRDLELFLACYEAQDCPPLHHSAAYREAYRPHYRVIDRDLAVYFPALCALQAALEAHSGPVVAAVDGRCAAGKTTFAARVKALYGDDCAVFHMDDYFLPPEKRTPQRLEQPGGNVDYERAAQELFLPLSQGRDPVVRPFDCASGRFLAGRTLPHARLNLIEGSYALHPVLARLSQVGIFFTVSPELQLSRLAAREAPESLGQFTARWIPMEERYFAACKPQEGCAAVVDASLLPSEEEAV